MFARLGWRQGAATSGLLCWRAMNLVGKSLLPVDRARAAALSFAEAKGLPDGKKEKTGLPGRREAD
jgi:hypothetical protein